MEIQYFGANCVRLNNKKASIIIDDNLAELGAKSPAKTGDIALFTSNNHGAVKSDTKLVIDEPGEFEVSDISIQGIPARAHVDEEGTKQAVMYKILMDDLRIAVVGHVYPELSGDQLETLNTVDVLILPVGGNGYTLDPVGALKLIKDIEPKVIIPTHFDDKAITYPVPQQSLSDALKGLAMEPQEAPVAKLKLKQGNLSEITQLVVLERQ